MHTYFSGSEQNVFRAYRNEVGDLKNATNERWVEVIGDIFKGQGLKTAAQKYEYKAAGNVYKGENVYAVLEAPRGDATEAIVLCAAWLNMDGVQNESGVALVLALARYFKRWSLWSKDVIFLISADSRAGPQAWVDAYHELHDPATISSLPVKSGAIQGVVALDYPTRNNWETIHIVYDGINGQLPNLDLFNTAVHIAGNQMGVRANLQEMFTHTDDYRARLRTMLRGMVNQGLGHATGPHSSFIPYHIDAVTLQAAGTGWHDELTMGRIVESLFRSLNNLLEHFHQSFFFYLLLAPRRFVSIGTYLPSAMLIAVSFTIAAIGHWISTGLPSDSSSAAKPKKRSVSRSRKGKYGPSSRSRSRSRSPVPPAPEPAAENCRELLQPISIVLLLHLLGTIPLYIFNNIPPSSQLFHTATATTLSLPLLLSLVIPRKHYPLITTFSLLLLGLFLSALATINFSLSFLVGMICAPFSVVDRWTGWARGWAILLLAACTPSVGLFAVALYWGEQVETVLEEAAFGWGVQGLWTQVVVWGVWWPAWLATATVVVGGWRK